jgi:HK97 family phage major capsid protein
MSFQSKALREKANKLAVQAQDLNRNGLDTTEKRMSFDKLMDDAEKAVNEARKLENEEARTAVVADAINRDKIDSLLSPKQKEYRTAFAGFLRSGMTGLSQEDRTVLRAAQLEMRTDDQTNSMWGRVTGQSYNGTSGTQGGVFVPASFQYEVDVATKYYARMMDDNVCRVIKTATGAVLPFPTSNDTGNEAAVLADAVQDSEVPVPVSVVNFGAYKYSSRIIRVAVELLQDSAFNLEDFLKDAFATRFGRAYESAFTTGAGMTAPTGILTAVLASGATPIVAVGSSANDGVGTAQNSIGTQDLVALEHSVDPSYRIKPNSGFMFHDQTLKVLKQLLDKYGRPIWQAGIGENVGATILGYPYTINQSLPQIGGTGTKSTALFGDMSKFVIRSVRDMNVLRLDERYADYGQVGFIAFSRVDSNLVDAGTHPVNSLQSHS